MLFGEHDFTCLHALAGMKALRDVYFTCRESSYPPSDVYVKIAKNPAIQAVRFNRPRWDLAFPSHRKFIFSGEYL